MAALIPLDHAGLAGVPPRAEHYLPYVHGLEQEHPGYLASIGTTPEEYAVGMAEPALSIEASVAVGYMSPAEGRFLQGKATREDLIDLGYTPAEIEVLLAEQQARSCASSA
jgi:hypothetical protein